MKTYADTQQQVYEVIGQTLLIHWNMQEVPTQEGRTQWQANEAVCHVSDGRSAIIEKIIGSVYTTGSEIATINNQASDPVAYADYQAFRAQAKQLADGWVNQENK